jgi:glycosyltransferase involved in cell wall biosynthesis
MKITIVTVCFNAAAVIEGCLRSVAEQTHNDVEHIVIDGASRDGTLAIVRRFQHVARLVSEPDRGLYDAMNKGIALAAGDYILFLNADDRFVEKDTLKNVVRAIGADPGADVYFGALQVRPLDGTPFIVVPPAPADAPEALVTGCLPHQSTLARPAVFQKTGLFDLRYRFHAEYDWYLKILADSSIDVRRLDIPIGSFLDGGMSSRLRQAQPEVFAIQAGSPLYAGHEWDRRRIAVLQEAYLRERITVNELREQIAASQRTLRRPSAPQMTSSFRKHAVSLKNRIVPMLPHWLASPIRAVWRVARPRQH